MTPESAQPRRPDLGRALRDRFVSLVPYLAWAATLPAMAAPDTSARLSLSREHLEFRSTWSGPALRSLDEKSIPWAQSNERVRELGGHAGHLRARATDGPHVGAGHHGTAHTQPAPGAKP